MIRPHKYMDLKLSIVNVSYSIIKLLKIRNVFPYDELYNSICRELREDSIMEIFNLSLTFLYSFNAIRYDKQTDHVELLINENIKDIFK